jgi:vesicle-fusing ATPase
MMMLMVCFFKVQPAFGTQEEDLRRLYDMGIIPYSDAFANAKSRLLMLARQVRDSDRDGLLVSTLVEGAEGSGKTAIMANVALEAGFPYVKLISPDQLIQHHESSKVSKIRQVFEDAYKTQLAMILIDDVERLLEYANINSSVKFSNMVLQALMVLLKRRPPSRCHLMVVVTTSVLDQMQLLHFDSVFYSIINLPMLTKPAEFECVLQATARSMKPDVVEAIIKSIKQAMTIKGLLNALETASQECGKDLAAITFSAFMTALSMAPMHVDHAR